MKRRIALLLSLLTITTCMGGCQITIDGVDTSGVSEDIVIHVDQQESAAPAPVNPTDMNSNPVEPQSTEEPSFHTDGDLLPDDFVGAYTGDGYPRHAPNVYVDFLDNVNCDILTVDWCCIEDGYNTYYAVHNWNGGYAGFQSDCGEHKLLLSIWDGTAGVDPTVEYSLDGNYGEFGGEGTGQHVFTSYDWKVGTWYTMRIQEWQQDGVTYIGQWVREEGGEWLTTAIISLPTTDFCFEYDSMFMEDYTMNNELRACAMKNAYGKLVGEDTWINHQDWTITNNYYPYDDTPEDQIQWNINFDSSWEISEDGQYVAISSGGSDFSDSGYCELPVNYTLVNQTSPDALDFLQP